MFSRPERKWDFWSALQVTCSFDWLHQLPPGASREVDAAIDVEAASNVLGEEQPLSSSFIYFWNAQAVLYLRARYI